MTTNNKQRKSLKQRLTEIAKDYADTCWDFDNGDKPPVTPEDCYEQLKYYVGDVSGGGGDSDDEFEENRLLLLGAMTWGYKETTWIDWNDILEYVEALYDAYKEENEEESEEEEEQPEPQTEGEKAHARVWNAQIETYTKQFLVT